MRRRGARSRLLLAALLAPLAVSWGAAPGEDARRGDLEGLRREIAELEERVEEVRHREEGISGAVERTRLELRLQRRRVEEAVAERDAVSDELAASEARATELGERISALEEELAAELVSLYRLGRHGSLRLLLSVSSRGDLLPAIRSLRYLARRNERAVTDFRRAREELLTLRRRLEERRRELEAWVAEEAARRDELARLGRRQEEQLAELARRRRALAARAERLEEKAARLARLIAVLEAEGGEVEGRPMQRFRGALDWPVEGTVEVGFGPRLDPLYGTRVPHNGVELRTPEGAEVRAIYPGEVLYAAPFRGFGRAVVVRHPGGVLSLVARLSELRVEVGRMVALEDVLGRSGGVVYLEIREGSQARDPLEWLR